MKIFINGEVIEYNGELYDPFPEKKDPSREKNEPYNEKIEDDSSSSKAARTEKSTVESFH